MKSLLILLAAVFGSILVLAQAPTPVASPTPAPLAEPTPGPAAASPTPEAAGNTHDAAATVPLPGQSTGPTLEKNIPLMPETAPEGTEAGSHHRAHGSVSPHPTGTFEVEQDIRVRVRMRVAETQALKVDPSLDADWIAAHQASTDPERRAILGRFYSHLYDRMAKLDPSIATHAEVRKQITIERMKYTRLGELDNSEDPFGAPTPEPSGPKPPAEEPVSQ